MDKRRVKVVDQTEFKSLLEQKKIRPASLQDVEGIHHKRPLYRHPFTRQFWVAVN